MEEIVFYKYEGTGNDFIMLDNRMKKFPADENLIKHLCDRRFGIGADGLILLEQQDGYDFRMVYFNSDGRESTFCGNGGRCAAAFARQLGLVQDTTYFMAKDGEHQASFEGNQVRLKMSDAGFPAPSGEGFTLFTGSPHYVEFNADVMQADVFGQGRKIRQSFGEDGINVNFVEEKTDGILIRTYERGVEDETLSCGTGVTAAALLASTRGYESPVLVESKGGQLRVEFSRSENGFTGVFLTGPVRQVFSGTIRI